MALELSPDTGGRLASCLVCPLSLRNLLMLTRRRLLVLVRSLAVTALVALTSLGVVAAPVAHATELSWVKDWHRIFPAPDDALKTAGKVGTKVGPARAAVCLGPQALACLALNTAVVGGTLYLTSETGKRHMAELGDWLLNGDLPWARSATETYCQGTMTPAAWGQHQVSFSWSVEGEGIPQGAGQPRQSCADAFDAGMFAIASNMTGDCIKADGALYKSGVFLVTKSRRDAIYTVCDKASTDWLIGFDVPPEATSNVYKLENPGYYKNPTWNGTPGADPDWWNGPDSPVAPTGVRVTVQCMRDDGSTFTKTATSSSITDDPQVSCGPDASPVLRTAHAIRDGRAAEELYRIGADPDMLAEYPLCMTGPGCDMGVKIDGVLCTYQVAGCADWWDFAVQNPERVECAWGPYTLPWEDCRELRHAYETPDGVWYPPEYGTPTVPFPPPVVIEDPGYRPNPGYGGADPRWLVEGACPAVAVPGVSTYGLQPVALNGLYCFIPAHPGFTLTSGYRDPAHSEWYSDHPYGLAVDLGVPDWSTAPGNQRGWDAVAYWITNSTPLGVDYVIFDGAIWWPATGWHVYTGPSPHRDHIHVSFTSLSAPPDPNHRAPVPAPVTPYPQPTPSPEPAPPTNPEPTPKAPPVTDPADPDPTGPVPDPDPDAPFPTTGENPPDPDGCLSTSWTWDPMSWVLSPVKCAMLWAFVPSPEAVTQTKTDIAEAVGGTGVTVWADLVGDIPDSLAADESVASCLGPGLTLPDPIGTVYMLDACSGIRATLAATCKTIAGATIVVGALLSCLSFIGRALGFETAVAQTTAPLAQGPLAPAAGPGDAAASAGGVSLTPMEQRLQAASRKATRDMGYR